MTDHNVEVGAYLWRVEINAYETWMSAQCWGYRVIRVTRCGVWISLSGDYAVKPRLKFVNLQARKQWACPSYTAAVEAFIARKRRQMAILRSQLTAAAQALEYARDSQKDFAACPITTHTLN